MVSSEVITVSCNPLPVPLDEMLHVAHYRVTPRAKLSSTQVSIMWGCGVG